jgi:hypothetical protein
MVDGYNNLMNRKHVCLALGFGLILLFGGVFPVQRVTASNGADTPYYKPTLMLARVLRPRTR